ncbi:MAG: hypothetical protein ACTSQY_00050 [Candidatus Odinarchaeia archaeon]|nr:MAG: hypothetical protein [Lokiarchaeota virus Fenrir Meg22_1012]URC17189.1 MAG: hypothetical protein [Lokiarchaeota virus Fenrir Meg22_1214]
MEIKITLGQASKLLKSIEWGGVTFRALKKCEKILAQHYINQFKKPHSDTYKIENMRELERLIRGGTKHEPLEPEPGAPYSEKYLSLKERYGEEYPHKFMEYGFWGNWDIYTSSKSLRLKVEKFYKRGFDYMEHHEQRRSVLKAAFVDAWQDMIKMIILQIAYEAMRYRDPKV